MNIGKAIKQVREKKGIRIPIISRKLNVSVNKYSFIERQKEVSEEEINKIAEILEVPSSYIIFLSLEDEDIKEDKLNLYNSLKKNFEDLVI